MRPGGILTSVFSPMFGTKTGSSMALLYVITSVNNVFFNTTRFAGRSLQDVEDI